MFFSFPACHFQQRPLAHTQIALKLFDGVVVDVKKSVLSNGVVFQRLCFQSQCAVLPFTCSYNLCVWWRRLSP